jgi:peptidoglycan hydrolase-like protein with peptidoglycan-binding domain
MKRFTYTLAVLAIAVAIAGCAKKQEALEEMQQPMAPEDLSRLKTEAPGTSTPVPQAKTEAPVPQAVAPTQGAPLEKLPPAGPYKPTDQEIQTALKNAGFYAGTIDGKIGPASKKAIEEFQKANNLNPDGKVGPKTWAALIKYLSGPAPVVTKPVKPATTKKK